jgi:hypothetical protein
MNDDSGFILAHGHYQKLLSYRKAEIIYDLTYRFCSRLLEQMDRGLRERMTRARLEKRHKEGDTAI